MKEVKTGQTKHEVQNNGGINLGQCKMACVLSPYLPWQLSNTMTFFCIQSEKTENQSGPTMLMLEEQVSHAAIPFIVSLAGFNCVNLHRFSTGHFNYLS